MAREESVEIACVLLRETDSAWLVDEGDKEVWLPKSKCEWDPDNKVMIVPEWLANKEGLI